MPAAGTPISFTICDVPLFLLGTYYDVQWVATSDSVGYTPDAISNWHRIDI